MERRFWSLGWCPICTFMGELILLVRKDARDIAVVYCPSCKGAWPFPPEDGDYGSFVDIETLAPNGVATPTESEIAVATGGSSPGGWLGGEDLLGLGDVDWECERPLPD